MAGSVRTRCSDCYFQQIPCERCRKRVAKSQARQAKDDVMRSLGLVKVRGCVSGKTYWE